MRATLLNPSWCSNYMLLFVGPVAQRLEQSAHNALVGGSNPSGPTIFRPDVLQNLLIS